MFSNAIGVNSLIFELLEVLFALFAGFRRQKLVQDSQVGSVVDCEA